LGRDFKSQICIQPASVLDDACQRLTLNKLHRVKVVAADLSKMMNRRNIGMTDTGSGSGFVHEALSGRSVADEFGVDDLQRDWPVQLDVEGFVGDPHRAVAELYRSLISVLKDLVFVETKFGSCRVILRFKRVL
jgi:hypothetical protein